MSTKSIEAQMRLRPPDMHPVEFGQYVVPTPFTDAASKFIGEIVWRRLPGCLVYGTQRFGKSHALVQVVADLRERFGDSLVIVVIMVEFMDERPRMAGHYQDHLEAVDHMLPDQGIGKDKRRRFREFIVEQVAGSAQRRLVLIYDDAQFLWAHQYGWMMSDYNYFYGKGIKPTYALVGQRELLDQKRSFISAGRQQLVGRFMVQEHEFHGVRNIDDLREILKAYDEYSEYPEEHGFSYSAYFFTAAFANGWRLASHAQEFMDSYTRLKTSRAIPIANEIGLQYLMPVIEQFLIEFKDSTLLSPHIDSSWLEDAILWTGYIDAEKARKPDKRQRTRKRAGDSDNAGES